MKFKMHIVYIICKRYAPDLPIHTMKHTDCSLKCPLFVLAQEFPTLVLKQQQYTHTNGSTVQLLMADGTLPMYYQVCSMLIHLQASADTVLILHTSCKPALMRISTCRG